MNLLIRWLARIVVIGAGLTAISAMAGGQAPLIAILGHLALYAMIGSACAAIALWRIGAPRSALIGAGVAALNLAILAPSQFGANGPSAAETPRVKLLLFNVWWKNESAAAILSLVRDADPDVIVLNEVYAGNRPLLRALDAQYPYRVECWTSAPCDTLILSRLTLSEPDIMTDANATPLGVAKTGFSVGDCPVTLFAVHLNRPWPARSLSSSAAQHRQADALAEVVRGWPGAKIVAGDLNATPWTAPVKRLAEAVKGQALAGWYGTWPWFLPAILKLPIDHVIVSRPQLAGRRTVLGAAGSDHHAVLAELTAEDCRP